MIVGIVGFGGRTVISHLWPFSLPWCGHWHGIYRTYCYSRGLVQVYRDSPFDENAED